MAEHSGNPPGPPHIDKIHTPAACASPFRPYCRGAVTRMRNVSKYMLVLAPCLVVVVLQRLPIIFQNKGVFD